MNRFEDIEPDLSELGELLTAAIVKELSGQGHRATGQLIQSVYYRVLQLLGGVELQVLYLDYGRYLELGRAPGGKKVPINALMNWIRIKQIAVEYKAVKRLAFIFQRKIFIEGSPTRGSYQFSSNGRRKEFQLQVLNENRSTIEETTQRIMEEWFNLGIEGMVSELNRAA